MDFASPVASSIAGEQTDSASTGKTFATWAFNKAKCFATQWPPLRTAGSAVSTPDAASGYREHHHPSAVGEGPSP